MNVRKIRKDLIVHFLNIKHEFGSKDCQLTSRKIRKNSSIRFIEEMQISQMFASSR